MIKVFFLVALLSNITPSFAALVDEVKVHDDAVEVVHADGQSNFFGGVSNRFLLWLSNIPPEYDFSEVDPWEGFNRSIYSFNNGIDVVVKPVAQGYRNYTPKLAQAGVSNFFHNITDVNTLVNQLLQLKIAGSVETVFRLILNTTVGLGGLIELIPRPSQGEDFGQTLAVWGVGAGPYLVLPFLGPSTVRDGFGITGFNKDIAIGTLPAYSISMEKLTGEDDVNLGVTALNFVRVRSALLPITNLLEKSDDPYISLRNAYLQRRAYQVADGDISEDDEEF